ncbi:MAG: flagellar hook-basal body complex protein [Lachnospiraceae bacterium]|nr:flagellar hook-basal body complex protein [Lachnospiraceae bacterium]
MMRSLFSGVAGLRTHQTRMDVIGNNIANVNTVAYKSSSVTFQDLLYQTTQNATGANEKTGRAGINAKQIGLGVSTGSISTNISTSGSAQTTGSPFDIRITGDSFFVVSDGSNQYFTRAGAFNVDANGTLCMATNGYTVQGYGTTKDATTGEIVIDTSNLKALDIMSDENLISDPVATTNAYITGILDENSDALKTDAGQVVSVPFIDNLGYSYSAQFKIEFNYDTSTDPPTKLDGQYQMSLTDILDSKGKSIFYYGIDDTLGGVSGVAGEEMSSADKLKTLKAAKVFNFGTGTTPDGNTAYLTFDTYKTPSGAKPKGTLMKVSGTSGGANVPDPPVKTEINGQDVTGVGLDLDALRTFATGMAGMMDDANHDNAVSIDLSTMKNIDNKGTSTVNGKRGSLTSDAGAGCKVGDMSSISIGQDGKIVATYTNGQTKLLGQIATATFANASGLEKEGDNLYAATLNSGEAVINDITANGGSMTTGELEMSNVDLSAEFTDMITTQRGFQANSRIITVSDTMLEELVNLKR